MENGSVRMPESRRRRARACAVLAALIVALAVLPRAASAAAATPPKEGPARYWEKKVDDLLASYRAKGEPVTWQDVLARQQKLPPEKNSALAFEKAFKELHKVIGGGYPETWVMERAKWGVECSPQSLKLCLRYLGRFRDVLADLERAGRQAHGAYALPTDPSNLYETMDYVSGTREAAQLLALAAFFDVQQGRGAESAKKLLTMRRLSASFGHCWLLIEGLVRMANDARLTNGLRDSLSIGQIPSRDLATLSAELKTEEREANLLHAFYGERAFAISSFQKGSAAEFFESRSLANLPESERRLMAQPGQKSSEEWHLLTAEDELIRIAALPPREMPAAIAKLPERTDTAADAMMRPGLFARLLTPAMRRALEESVDNVARLRVARAAIAVERCRLEHGKWPKTLEAAVPDFIGAVPIDPYSGKPILYRHTDQGVVVYSVGRNGRDDGGVEHDKETGRFLDIPFRLLDADKRPLRTTTFLQEPKVISVLERLGMTEGDMLNAGLTKKDIQEMKAEERSSREFMHESRQKPYKFLQGRGQ